MGCEWMSEFWTSGIKFMQATYCQHEYTVCLTQFGQKVDWVSFGRNTLCPSISICYVINLHASEFAICHIVRNGNVSCRRIQETSPLLDQSQWRDFEWNSRFRGRARGVQRDKLQIYFIKYLPNMTKLNHILVQ